MSDKNSATTNEEVVQSPTKPTKIESVEGPSTPKKAKLDFDFWKIASSPTACSKEAIKVYNLTPRYYPNRSLTLRVSYFTSFKARSGKTIFKFQGEDDTGMIQCVCFDDETGKLSSTVTKLKQFITITDFRVVKENPNYSSGLNDGFEIVLLPGTQIVETQSGANLPPMVFEFVRLDALENYLSSKIDVMVIVVQELESTGSNNGPCLTLAVTDQSKKTVKLAFWNAIGDSQDLKDFPIMIVRKATVKEYKGCLSLTCGNDACVWVRPDIEQARNLEEWFKEERAKLSQAEGT